MPRDFEDPDALTILSEAWNRNGARLLSLQTKSNLQSNSAELGMQAERASRVNDGHQLEACT